MSSPSGSGRHVEVPGGILLVMFVVGGIVAAGVAFLGATDRLGLGVPGQQQASAPAVRPLSDCEGKDMVGTFHFVIVAGAKGAIEFNGSSPGPCFAVGVGSRVTVELEVAPGYTGFDSWELINGTGATNQLPVFSGAGWSTALRFSGIYTGEVANFSFVAGSAGEYRYVSEVGDHAQVGAWGPFNVTGASGSTVGAALPRGIAPGGPIARTEA